MTTKNWLLSSLIFAFGVIFRIATAIATLVLLILLGYLLYTWGRIQGAAEATQTIQAQLSPSPKTSAPAFSQPISSPSPSPRRSAKPLGFSGPELWQAVNQSRIEHGVNPLKQLDVFCTVASIRLNQQLTAGTLDNHAGFEPTLNQISEAQKYNIAEFLVYTPGTATDAVNLWLNTLGHRALLTGGEYVYGCTYAQDGYGVAIAGY